MKKIVFALLFMTISFSAISQLTKAERKMVVKNMKHTLKALTKATKGLSEAQLNYKPAADKWSIKECIYHLGITEIGLWDWMKGTLSAPANPDKRNLIKVTDEQLMAGIEDRTNKVKTQEAMEPKNAKWNTAAEAMAFLKDERKKHIDWVKSSADDFRNHVAEQTPLGALDAYQLILLMSQHMVRHTKQIEEVKAATGYPAK